MTSVPHFRIGDEAGGLLDQVTPESMRPFLLERADGHAGAVTLVAVDVVLPAETDPDSGAETRPARRLEGRAVVTPESGEPGSLASAGAGGWAVRLTDGGSELRGRAPNTDAVFDLLRSWAAGDDWWREAFSWEPAGD